MTGIGVWAFELGVTKRAPAGFADENIPAGIGSRWQSLEAAALVFTPWVHICSSAHCSLLFPRAFLRRLNVLSDDCTRNHVGGDCLLALQRFC